MSPPVCVHCGEAISNPKTAWKEMRGWVSPEGAKGFTQAKPTGRLIHESCMAVFRGDGPIPGQTTIDDFV